MPRSAVALARLAAPAAPATSDAQLLRAFTASQGDDAFAELVRRHGPMVLSVCRRVLSDAHDAEDAFQATFLVLARKAGSVRGTNVAGWLYGVAARTARGVRVMRDRRRKHSVRGQGTGVRGQESDAPAPDSALVVTEQAAIIDEELAKLAEHHRDVLVVCELRGLSRRRAAAELGIPEGTLSSRLAAAKRKLAERLSARGLAGAVALAAALAPAAVPAALLESTALAVRGAAGSVAGVAASTVLKGMLFDQLRATVLAAAVLAAAVCGGLAMTGPAEAPPEKPAAPGPRPVEDPAAALVKQLGGDDFAAREAAAKELRKLGLKAEPALKAALKSDDPEVRARAAKLLAEVRKDALETLKTFDPKGAAEPDHPIWKRFKTIAGGDAPARELFAELIADRRRLAVLDAADRDPDRAGDLYAAELQRWYTHVQKLLDRPTTGTPDPKETPYPEAIAVMYLGTYATSTGKVKEGWRWEGHLFIESWGEVTKSAVGPAARRVFVAWLALRDAPDTRERGLAIAAGDGVKEALPFARKVLADEKDVPEQRARAALLIGIVGARDDLALLRRAAESKLANEPFLHFNVVLKGQHDLDALWGKQRFGVKVTPEDLERAKAADIRTCNRSVADCTWAAAVRLAGGKPEELGFLWPRTALGGKIDAGWFATVQIHGFPSDEARAAAYAKAKAFLDKRKEEPKEEPKPDPAAAKLVGQLASDDFAEREAAAKELRALGAKAEAALKDGAKSDNPEVRERCGKLLDALRADRLAAPDSPVWLKFKAVAGDDADAKKLYQRTTGTARRGEMLLAAVTDPKAAAASYDRECEAMATALKYSRVGGQVPPPRPAGLDVRDVTTDDLAALLFLGTLPRGDQGQPDKESVAAHGAIREGLRGETKAAFARLYAAWAEPRPEYAANSLSIGLEVGVPELAGAARKALAAKAPLAVPGTPPGSAYGLPLQFLGRHGTAADIPLVMKFADDKTECAKIEFSKIEGGALGPWRPAVKGADVVAQVRDVAVIAALRLSKKRPQDFGFEQDIVQDGGPPPAPHWVGHLGFCRDADRAAAHKKAREWLDKQK